MACKHTSVLTGVVVILSIFAPAAVNAGDDFWLITAAEAQKAHTPDGKIQQLMRAVAGPGPQIVLRNPRALAKVYAPVDILVTFEPGDSGLPPDMDSFKATLIGFFDIDLTNRVKEHLVGPRLDVKSASLPTGSHRIRIAIRDTEGNPNERDLDVTILAAE